MKNFKTSKLMKKIINFCFILINLFFKRFIRIKKINNIFIFQKNIQLSSISSTSSSLSFSSATSLPFFTNFFSFSFLSFSFSSLSFSFSSKISASLLNFLPLTCFSRTESLLINFFFVNLQNKNLLEIKKMLRRKKLVNLTCLFCIPRHREGISKHLLLCPLQFYSFCSKLLKI